MNANQDYQLDQDEAERLSQLRRILDEAGARYEIFSHPRTIRSAEDGVEEGVGNLAAMAPALILETDKGLLVAIHSGETRLSYKKIKKTLGLKDVSLAQPEVVLRQTGARVGTVSLVNLEIPTIIDRQITKMTAIYGGCGVQCHTLRINPLDLIHVTGANVFDFAEPKTMLQK